MPNEMGSMIIGKIASSETCRIQLRNRIFNHVRFMINSRWNLSILYKLIARKLSVVISSKHLRILTTNSWIKYKHSDRREKRKLWFVNNSEIQFDSTRTACWQPTLSTGECVCVCECMRVIVYIQSENDTPLSRFNTHTYASHVDIVGEMNRAFMYMYSTPIKCVCSWVISAQRPCKKPTTPFRTVSVHLQIVLWSDCKKS